MRLQGPRIAGNRRGLDSASAEFLPLFRGVATLGATRDELAGWLAEQRELKSNIL